MEEKILHLTDEWDKTFPKSEKVNHRKVMFITATGSRWRQICTNRKELTENCRRSQ